MVRVDNRSEHSLRRLREEPLDTVTHLIGDLQARQPTSLGEAQAAAYLDGRLRLAGMRVSADTFRAPRSAGWDGPLMALPALISVILYARLPNPSLLLVLWGLVISVAATLRPGMRLFAQRNFSQNVIATRAVTGKPRRRVVLLAPLDAPQTMSRFARLLADDARPQVGRMIAYATLVLLSILAWFGPLEIRLVWWYAQFLPTAYLCLLSGVEIWLLRVPASPGAISYAGALAAMLASAEDLSNLERTELWAVALGASATGAGLADFLKRYPFDRDMTLFIGIEGIGAGNLCYVTREGLLLQYAGDPQLLQLAAAADVAVPLINAQPSPYRRELTTAARLRRAGWRALSIACLGSDGETPLRASLADLPSEIDPQLLQRSTRLLSGLVRQIDQIADRAEVRKPGPSTR